MHSVQGRHNVLCTLTMPASEATAPVERTRPLLFKKRTPEEAPITNQSAALFRFGEQCNNHCPMCSNTGAAGLFFHPTAELLKRAAFLREQGFRRVVVTGGEATIHPGFWTVMDQLAEYGMRWDTNTHGRTFARPGFAARAVATGLERAIVSLHSHHPKVSAEIFGSTEAAHFETVEGIEKLLQAGVEVMLNCVLTRLSLDHMEDYLRFGHQRFGREVTFKFVFPSTIGKGGQWSEIETLRYADVRALVRALRKYANAENLKICFESFPNCVVQDRDAINLGRSAFGESHYLDDATGDRIYSMRHIEAELSAYGEACRQCSAVRRCPGIARAYAKRYGTDELTPL